MSADRSDDPDSREAVLPYLSVEMSRAGGDWDAASEEIVLRVAQFVFEQLGDQPAAEVSILLADNAFVQSLNRKFRGQDKPTNVLSFPHAASPTRKIGG